MSELGWGLAGFSLSCVCLCVWVADDDYEDDHEDTAAEGLEEMEARNETARGKTTTTTMWEIEATILTVSSKMENHACTHTRRSFLIVHSHLLTTHQIRYPFAPPESLYTTIVQSYNRSRLPAPRPRNAYHDPLLAKPYQIVSGFAIRLINASAVPKP